MGWPQWILVIYIIFDILYVVDKQGTAQPDYCGVNTILGSSLLVGLLYWGGFLG